jgi:hypothetical protein
MLRSKQGHLLLQSMKFGPHGVMAGHERRALSCMLCLIMGALRCMGCMRCVPRRELLAQLRSILLRLLPALYLCPHLLLLRMQLLLQACVLLLDSADAVF